MAQDAKAPEPEPDVIEPDTSEPEIAATDFEDKWLRAAAELQNAGKRYERELKSATRAERRRTCLAWLPVVDNLELALEHAAPDDPVVAGVRAVRDQAVDVLRSLGYPRDDEVGIPFDPLRHEVIGVVEDADVPSGTVVTVLRAGYGEPTDRQLRAAAVLVSRSPE